MIQQFLPHKSQNTKKLNTKKECVNFILHFLAWKGYNACSVSDLLRSPPLKVLLDIWNFLFRLVDKNVTITKENMAVEVPKFYNDFGYPHIMTTSHLKTPTAERQWESNLVALSWLCKLLLYEHENFHKDFEKKSTMTQTDSYMFDAAFKMNIKNPSTYKTVTEWATEHLQLYINVVEKRKSIPNDFEEELNKVLSRLEKSVNSKTKQLNHLRTVSEELQKEIQEFDDLKERVNTIKIEIKTIEDLTNKVKDYCNRMKNELELRESILTQETNSLIQMENSNKEFNDKMNLKIVSSKSYKIIQDGKNIKEINQDINQLKLNLNNCSKKMRELENDRLSLSSEVSKNYNLIVKSLSASGIDTEPWKEFEVLLKKIDPHSPDHSKSLSDDLMNLANDIDSELSLQGGSVSDLQKTLKSLEQEIEDLRVTESDYSNSTTFNKEKSHLISENEYLVSELTKRELENTRNDLDLANKRLLESRSQANYDLQKYIKGLREVSYCLKSIYII
ncbi:uncharacterized protein TA19405 [Theileria annulata]|uniref:Kinetochore protein NDC80 n=1 Tax=Theileria annulata TaxID=5874 RepID=Q4UGF1_THEAN|nr:uncharacterized protein TA19405 [Theileria annulata]CAI73838.1 hypothetical protein, conserved [Theileria annulata]|eukprot:XP_954515.1 hypothetical protein, conserved [Theileria annulata]